MALGGKVRGTRTMLRTPVEADLASYNAWMADLRLRRFVKPWHQPAMPATWKERFTEQTKDKDSVLWSIEAEGRLVGLVIAGFGWTRRDEMHVDQLVIAPDEWRKGYGSDAALALHRYFFDYLDLRRVATQFTAENAAARRIAERLGYTEFAHKHEVHWRDGGYADEIEALMERETWHERFPHEREYEPLGAVRSPKETA